MKKKLLIGIFSSILLAAAIYTIYISGFYKEKLQRSSNNFNKMTEAPDKSAPTEKDKKKVKQTFETVIDALEGQEIKSDKEVLKFINKKLPYRIDTLHDAVKTGSKRIVEAYINVHGDEINFNSLHNGITPLHAAIRYRHKNLVNFLIQKGANTNKAGTININKSGMDKSTNWTPLMEASYVGTPEIADVLLKNGAKINKLAESNNENSGNQKKSWNGWFPLVIATYHNNPKTVKVLLSHGANPNRKIKKGRWKGWTAKGIAEEYKYKEILKIFKNQK